MKLCHFNCCDSCVSSCRMLCAIFASALATNLLFISLLCKLYCCYYFINVFFVQFVRKNIYRSKQKEYRMVTAAYSRLCQNVRPLLRMTFWISIFSTQKTTTPPYWSYSVRHIQCVFNSNKLLTHSAMCTMCAWVCMCVTVCTASACVFVCFDVYVTQLAKWRKVAAYGWMDGWMDGCSLVVLFIFVFCARAKNGTLEIQIQCHSWHNTHIYTCKPRLQTEVSFHLAADCQSFDAWTCANQTNTLAAHCLHRTQQYDAFFSFWWHVIAVIGSFNRRANPILIEPIALRWFCFTSSN